MKTTLLKKNRSIWALSIAMAIVLIIVLSKHAKAEEPLVLNLEQSLKMALEHSWSLKERGEEAQAAEYGRKQARGRFLPKLDAQARYTKLSEVDPMMISLPQLSPQQPKPEPMQLGDSIDEQYSLRLSAEQPIFSGGAIYNGYKAARTAEKAALSREDAEKEQIRLQVEVAYFNLMTARQFRSVTLQSVDVLEAHLERVKHLFDAGRLTRFELVEAESRLAKAKLSLVDATGKEKTAEIAFTTLLGIQTGRNVGLHEPFNAISSSIPSFDELRNIALVQNVDLTTFRLVSSTEKSKANAAMADMFPKLSLLAGYNYDNPNERYFPPESEFNDSWDVSVVLKWNFWSWGSNYYQARAARSEAKAAEHRVSRLEENTLNNLHKTWQDVRQGMEAITAATISVNAAEEALRLAEEQFKVGALTSTVVLEKELEMTQARTELVKAKSDHRIALAALRRIVGQNIIEHQK